MKKLTKERIRKIGIVGGFTFVITFILMNVYYQNKLNQMTNKYELEKTNIILENAGVSKDYTELTNKYKDLEDEYNKLSEQVYLMMDGKEYEFDIEHDDATHTFQGVKKGFWIDKKHMVIKVKSELQ